MKALRYPKDVIADVVQLVAPAPALLRVRPGRVDRLGGAPLRHRRRSPAAPLHKLTRSDVTTRNRRKAAALAADYDALEERIVRLQAAEDLARVRPDLDGNAIMDLLGVPPGPIVGAAWRYLKDLRLDRGPLSREEAEAELLRWARERGIFLTDQLAHLLGGREAHRLQVLGQGERGPGGDIGVAERAA
jgi:poly(A) polymerase